MLLRNGTVGGERVDLRIVNGLIAEIGSIEGAGIDLGGRYVSPGLWDNHVHFSQWALNSRRLDVSAATSAAEAASMVANAMDGQPLVGVGFRDGLWADAPTRDVLDAASGGIPVVLVSGDLHSAWLNSAALAEHGFADHPTGLLVEDDAFGVTNSVADVTDAQLDAWCKDAGHRAASRGVVGIVDLEMDWNLDTWQRRMQGGFDTQRVEFGIYTQHLDRAIAQGLHTGQPFGDLLAVGRYKVITDGSLNTRTAYCFDEYPGLEGTALAHGMLTVPTDELVPLMRKAVAGGLEPTVHAIGDHANTLVLDAFEQIGCTGRLEHAQLLALSDLARFAALGVTASVQPEHAMDDRDVADRYWTGRTDRAFVLRSLLDAGADLAFGSDAPVAPLDPWVTMAAAVGRARGGREPWHPEQSVSNAEAMAASVRSTVTVGQPADLVITPIDPLTATAEQLRTMPVDATVLAGRFTHNALGG
ncbi:MAG: amidohydrolase [Rhodoglobus sp.]